MLTKEQLSKHAGTKAGYKFKRKGNLYIEKRGYRKDKEGGKLNPLIKFF